MQPPSTLGQRIAHKRREKAFRDGRDVQQIHVAEAAHVSKAAISRYERDIDVPRERVLERIAGFLNTTPEWLRYGVGEGVVMVGPNEVTNVQSATDRALARLEKERAKKAQPPATSRRKRDGGTR